MPTKPKKNPQQTQAQRLLAVAKQAGVKDSKFAQAMGKVTMARNARKASRVG